MKVKRKISKIVVAALVGVGVLALSSVIALGNVIGTKHDLSLTGGTGFAYETVEICIFCHTPHGANTQIHQNTFINGSAGELTTFNTHWMNNTPDGNGGMLLWNRALSNATSYSLYTSPTLDSATGEVRIYSLLCLSCHDGVAALNVLQTNPIDSEDPNIAPQGSPMNVVSGSANIGFSNGAYDNTLNPDIGDRYVGVDSGKMELSNDHPISIDYNAALTSVDHGLTVPVPGCTDRICYVVAPGAGEVGLRLFYSAKEDAATSLECETCHDVHNQGTVGDGKWPFLVMSNEGSALCIKCHMNK